MPVALKPTMRLAAVCARAGGGPPRVQPRSSRLLAMATMPAAITGALRTTPARPSIREISTLLPGRARPGGSVSRRGETAVADARTGPAAEP
jgi:hypothetical protein